MAHQKRTHSCGELSAVDVGKKVSLSGWIDRRRDHGRLIFIDLRDRFGITQLIFDPEKSQKAHEEGSKWRAEWVVSVQGNVRARGEGLTNPKLKTGEIEIEVEDFTILSKAKTPPFSICDDKSIPHEDLRLKYRYLDMRRGQIAKNLIMRHKATLLTRNYFDSQGFLEITTPILARSTPEGARDYLVPSRIHPGNFYALPQSPQLFKQLLMIGGMERYFQIAPCFRDEDLRADRQPEFTQIDLEMSFSEPQALKKCIYGYIKALFKSCLNLEVPEVFEEMSYAYAMEHYGTDHPDMRFNMPLVRVDGVAKESSFSIFREAIEKGGCVKALCVKQGGDISRKLIDGYTIFVEKFGLQGLGWMKKQKEGLSSAITKFFTPDQLKKLENLLEAEEGDLLLFAAEKEMIVNQALDHLRRHIGKERGLINPELFTFHWVVDFPLLGWDPNEKRMTSTHHPFTAPLPEDLPLLSKEPLKVRSVAYDLIINGYEVGGGSQRIHDFELQQKIFNILNLSEEEISNTFGFFTEALQYGTPPHLGIAFGLDRLVMLLCHTENIRDVIAFPKTQKASDLMMQCPSTVSEGQLKELFIETRL
ncbi:MAG: aspartate--tRNA ligase [Simkania negevensis]|nr:aspartate--tRNA ligase [Simkania negevensis]